MALCLCLLPVPSKSFCCAAGGTAWRTSAQMSHASNHCPCFYVSQQVSGEPCLWTLFHPSPDIWVLTLRWACAVPYTSCGFGKGWQHLSCRIFKMGEVRNISFWGYPGPEGNGWAAHACWTMPFLSSLFPRLGWWRRSLGSWVGDVLTRGRRELFGLAPPPSHMVLSRWPNFCFPHFCKSCDRYDHTYLCMVLTGSRWWHSTALSLHMVSISTRELGQGFLFTGATELLGFLFWWHPNYCVSYCTGIW
jgi:hypothetical protein